jgi:hypothetical protein
MSTEQVNELGHLRVSRRVRRLPLASIRPSPENDKLYRPVDPSDPEVKALAASVAKNGVLEPLLVTLDHFILSGHRRYAAARLAGLAEVPCRVVDLRRTDLDFLPWLRECNRQRVKSTDEVFREELVSADPEEAYRLLVEHREKASQVSAETIAIVGKQHRCRITDAKAPMLEAILAVLAARRAFWPLTDRRIHYLLLNDPPLIHARKPGSLYQNNPKSYKALCELLTRARLANKVPMNAIHDPTRPVVSWQTCREVGAFIRGELDGFLKGYYRDLQQSQPCHIEIVGEKNTLEGDIRPVAMEYRIPYTLGRGYVSLPPRQAMALRFKRSGKAKLVLLVLSDFDPEGEDIGHAWVRSMRDDLGIANIAAVKVALTAAQVAEMGLPPRMKAKAKSSRRGKFVERHGEDVFELEAVPEERLRAILRQAIDSVLDLAAYNAEVDAEKRDAAALHQIRLQVQGRIGSLCNPEG